MGRVGVERVEGWGMAVGSTGRVVRPHSIDQLRAALAEAPPEALLLVLGSYLFGTFGGAAVAGWASHGDRIVVAGSTTLLLEIGRAHV